MWGKVLADVGHGSRLWIGQYDDPEQIHDVRIELAVGRVPLHLFDGGRFLPALPVGPPGSERTIGLRNGHDSGPDGNILLCFAVGIAAAEHILVMVLDDLKHGFRLVTHLLQLAYPLSGVFVDSQELLRAQSAASIQ